jgi:diguanylate cyclase (GGDEF)-like protein
VPEPTVEQYLAEQRYRVKLDFPGTNWVLSFRPTEAFFDEFKSFQSIFTLLGGFILTGLLAFNITRRIRYTHDVLHQAQHDALTSLPNRSFFIDRLNQLIASDRDESHMSAVLFLDLDNFKHINDSLGHAIGDQLLIDVGLRLRNNIRADDMVARMGGDEFIILVRNINSESAIRQLAQKVLKKITAPYHIDDRTFYLSASIGISVLTDEATDADTLIANADAAMYRAKASGRNTYDFYSIELTTLSMQRMQLELELRQAVKNKSLEVYYQPQIDLVNSRIIGAEALVRWTHPEMGAISQHVIIPVAEDSGLIVEIGEMVLRRACEQARAWIDAGLSDFTIAVNVSSFQLQRSNFIAMVNNVLEATGLPAANLELELTESAIMGQADAAIESLIELGQLGITLAIDDFGTGHSSLAYLKRLPIDRLKIDRSFVNDIGRDPGDEAICRAIIQLARTLGLETVAEGIEREDQAAFLLAEGCQYAQGFLYSRPLPANELYIEWHNRLTVKPASLLRG